MIALADRIRRFVLLGACLTSLSCGDGGGTNGASAPPAPAPVAGPTFASTTSVNVEENSTGPLYQAAASSPRGAPVTYSIAGGADGARFQMATDGQLRFFSPPKYDLPTDSDKNNIYVVQISANDGTASSTLSLNVTVLNSREGVFVRRVGTGFVDPVSAYPYSDSVVIVAESGGSIYSLNPQTGEKTLVLKIPEIGAPVRILSAIAGNDYSVNRTLLVMYVTFSNDVFVSRFAQSGSTIRQTPLGTMFFVASATNPRGWINFDQSTNGHLLIAYSDDNGSSQEDNSRSGKIFRSVARTGDPYAGASLPIEFADVTAVAKGLHRPACAIIFPLAGDLSALLIADRGQNLFEEINLHQISPSRSNFGWPFKEGNQAVNGIPPSGLIDPIITYNRTPNQAEQGIVCMVNVSSAYPSLMGQFVFVDRSGAIYSLPNGSLASSANNGTRFAMQDLERRDADFAPDAGTIDRPVSFMTGLTPRMYLLDADGEVFRVE